MLLHLDYLYLFIGLFYDVSNIEIEPSRMKFGRMIVIEFCEKRGQQNKNSHGNTVQVCLLLEYWKCLYLEYSLVHLWAK
jgi:hypothetical protein